ncbi:Auxin-responsive protein SAUR20 [Capsicum chinense]|nr:Auxin-responsive protein SAUR20 [Capsicum chinense]
MRSSTSEGVPKGHCAVYIGESQKKRFVMPVSYLNQTSFQMLLAQSEDEFGFDHSMGDLTIPCKEDVCIDLTTRLRRLQCVIGLLTSTSNSANNPVNHVTSARAEAMLLYSSSADLLDIICCFLDF